MNFVNETCFQDQGFGNQEGNKNFNSADQKNNYINNQNSRYQKHFNNNSGIFTKNYGVSSYQTSAAATQQRKMGSMIDQVLEGQQKMGEDFNEKLDVVYTELNNKFEALNTHVKKRETQTIQPNEAGKKQEILVKGKGEAGEKHYVNAIIEDEFWQVLRHVKLGEGDFEVERSMSFGIILTSVE